MSCSSCSCATEKCARHSEQRESSNLVTSEMQELSPLEQKCQKKSCQDERIAAVDDAATAEEHHSKKIEFLKKELLVTKRKLGQVEEDLELAHSDINQLRKLDLGLFYPKMEYMAMQMPGQPDDISIGQHLSENSEVILLCTYFD